MRTSFIAVARVALVGVAGLVALPACGATAPAPPAAPSESAAPIPAAGAPAAPAASAEGHAGDAAKAANPADVGGGDALAVPTECASRPAGLCLPPPAFVDRLCVKARQEVALALFAKSSPLTRLYLKGRVDELAFDEEVVALRFHGPSQGGMVVGSGAGTYDVLRWDGSCATGLEAEIFTRARPPHPRSARVQWHRLGERMQTELIAASDAIKRAHARRGKECKGAMTGDVSAACAKADADLVAAVADYVRGGGHVPAPED